MQTTTDEQIFAEPRTRTTSIGASNRLHLERTTSTRLTSRPAPDLLSRTGVHDTDTETSTSRSPRSGRRSLGAPRRIRRKHQPTTPREEHEENALTEEVKLSPMELRTQVAEKLCLPTTYRIWNKERIGLDEGTKKWFDYYKLEMRPSSVVEVRTEAVKNIMGSQQESDLPCVAWEWEILFRKRSSWCILYLLIALLCLLAVPVLAYKLNAMTNRLTLEDIETKIMIFKQVALTLLITFMITAAMILPALAYFNQYTLFHEKRVIDNFALSCLLGTRNCDIPREALKARLLTQRSRMIGLTEDVGTATKDTLTSGSSRWEVFIAGQIMAADATRADKAWEASGF